MQNNRQEQVEALEVLAEFNERLLKNMGIVVKELAGKRLDDTDQFLKAIIDAMNWEIQVVNGTISLLNEGKKRLDKEKFNDVIVELNDAILSKKDEEMAQAFENTIPEFEKLQNVVMEVLDLQK